MSSVRFFAGCGGVDISVCGVRAGASSATSSSSSSAGVIEAGGVGGRTAAGLEDLLSLLVFKGKIDPAQPFTVFFFDLLRFFCCSVISESEPWSEDEPVYGRPKSDALELIGRLFEVWPDEKDSKPKNDHLFDFVGLGIEGPTDDASATPINAGIEFLRRGDVFDCPSPAPAERSRIAPAVLGRDSSNSRVDALAVGAGLKSRSPGDAGETREEMLPETE